MQTLLQKLDEIANDYNRTKDTKYKDLWYKQLRKLSYGIRCNSFKRRPISSVHGSKKRG